MPAGRRTIEPLSHVTSTARTVAVALVTFASGTWALTTAPLFDAPRSALAHPAAQADCMAATETFVSGRPVMLGTTVRVSLQVDLTGCPAVASTTPWQLVFAIDNSHGLAASAEIRTALTDVITRFDLTGNAARRVGIVVFADRAQVACPLTRSVQLLQGCIDRLGTSGSPCLACGIDGAASLLIDARGRGEATRQTIVVISRVPPDAECESVRAASDRAKAAGIQLAVIAMRGHPEATCIGLVPSEQRLLRSGYMDGTFPEQLEQLRQRLATAAAIELEIEAWAAARMTMDRAYDGNVPAPVYDDTVAGRATWLVIAPDAHQKVGLRVVPQAIGPGQTVLTATGRLVNALGVTSVFTFPVPIVDVVPPTTPSPGPSASPTPLVDPSPDPQRDCPGLRDRAPAAAIAQAIARPAAVPGWGIACRVGEPVGQLNPLRRWLDLRNGKLPWHPMFNDVVYKCGCD